MYQDTITIIGLGSLLSEKSALRTCPEMKNFRYASISGYKRIFNKTDTYSARLGRIPKNNKKFACISAVPSTEINEMYVSVFNISVRDWGAFLQREFEYRLVEIPFTEIDSGEKGYGIVCMGDFNDDQECEIIIKADPLRCARWKNYKAVCSEPIWRYDLEPAPYYLRYCLFIIRHSRPEFLDNFMSTTFIADGRSIKEYLDKY